MARIPAATRESVPEDQRGVFDEVIKRRGEIPRSGPASVTINVPEIANRADSISGYLRRQSSLSPKVQELAMLVTARELDCQYIWNAHAASGRRAGIRDEVVDSLRDGKDLVELTAEESAVVHYGREFFRTHRVGQNAFDAALAQFGARGLVELTNLMGYYALLAFNVNAFEVLPLETGPEPQLPV